LPDDFNETINNQFCLILESNLSNNYSLNFKGLNGYDMTNIVLYNEGGTALVNATDSIKENTWYRITAVISDSGITTTIHDMSGAIIESKAVLCDATGANKMVLLIANSIDSAVAFKNLRIQTLNSVDQPQESLKPTSPAGAIPYLVISILLVLIVAAAIALYAKKKKNLAKEQH
jgi:hypothetical protein